MNCMFPSLFADPKPTLYERLFQLLFSVLPGKIFYFVLLFFFFALVFLMCF